MSDAGFDLIVLGGGLVGLWTARRAAWAGARVAVVEIGPEKLADQREASPPLRFSSRENLGALRARNHVLTGNSSYWGGGLVRNPRDALVDLYGEATAAAVEGEYPKVEGALGVREGFEPSEPRVLDRRLHEVAVLPGKHRGVWRDFGETGVTALCDCSVTGVRFDSAGRLEAITVCSGSGREQRLSAPAISLSMGVIDSNLFAQRWLAPVLSEKHRLLVGTRLHDHWSVPIASIAWRASRVVDSLFPPKFRAGIVAGRRLALERGFFHVVADLDSMPPYDRVKAFLRMRQQGRGPFRLMASAAATMASPYRMARAGLHYLLRHELYIPDGSEVRLVYDFESAADPENCLVATGDGATLSWDLRETDYARFSRALRDHRGWWERLWATAGIEARWLFSGWGEEELRNHLAGHAMDAYHLGGGLHPDTRDNPGVSEVDGTLRGCPNVFVNGTAFFSRPGPGNPVLTLLARANVLVERLVRGCAPR